MYDHLLVARLLLTLTTVGYGFFTIRADFNATHATNPKWTPHARFHVVWQILSYAALGLLALALIWVPGPFQVERLYIAASIAALIYGAFFGAFLAMPLYGGRAYDDNGYLPFRAPLPGRERWWDLNVAGFSVFSLILIAGTICVSIF